MGVIGQKTYNEIQMNSIIEYDELKNMSNEELLELIKDQGVILKMIDGTMNEVRIKGIIGTDTYSVKLIDYIGLSFYRHAIKSIEIISDCPKITL